MGTNKVPTFNMLLAGLIVVSLSGVAILFNFSRYITYGFMPLAVLCSINLNGFAFKFWKSYLFKFYLSLVLLAIFTLPFVINFETAIESIQTMIMILMAILFTTEYCKNQNFDYRRFFLYAIILGAMCSNILLFTTVTDLSLQTIRDDFEIGANTYSYQNYFALASMLTLNRINPSNLKKLAILFIYTMGVYAAFVTASRQAIIFTTILLVGEIIIGTDEKISTKRNILISAVFIVGMTMVAVEMLTIIEDTVIYNRFILSSTDEGRVLLIIDAFNVFLKHLFIGVGAGQYMEYSSVNRHFSHSTFSEAAANFGIFGLSLIVMFYLLPIVTIIQKETQKRRPSRRFLSLMIMNLVTIGYLNSYVFYLYVLAIIFHVSSYELLSREY